MLLPFGGVKPKVHPTAFVHPSAVVIGNVMIGKHSSVWPGAVVRGNFADIRIGSYTCIQDNAVVHSADVYEGKVRYLPVRVGNYVVVGHGTVLHGCTVEDNCLLGVGSTVFNGAVVREGALVGMGAVVLAGTEVPPGTIVVGIPARPLRKLTEEEIKNIRVQAENYASLAAEYKRAK